MRLARAAHCMTRRILSHNSGVSERPMADNGEAIRDLRRIVAAREREHGRAKAQLDASRRFSKSVNG